MAINPAGRRKGILTPATSPARTIIKEANPTNGFSKIFANGTVAIQTMAMPAKVPSIPARGVILFNQGPTMLPNISMMPPMKAAAIPTCQAIIEAFGLPEALRPQ